MTPWAWRELQMPAREVEQMTLRQADMYLMDWVQRSQKR
jgi:hypothetical protein